MDSPGPAPSCSHKFAGFGGRDRLTGQPLQQLEALWNAHKMHSKVREPLAGGAGRPREADWERHLAASPTDVRGGATVSFSKS